MKHVAIALGGFLGTSACLGLIPFGQEKSIAEMRKEANANARAFIVAVQARALLNHKYDNIMTSYAKDLGGKIPVNPCTGTYTGYTMIIIDNGRTARVAATIGKNCGQWNPVIYEVKLPASF